MADFAAAFAAYIDRCITKSVYKFSKPQQNNGFSSSDFPISIVDFDEKMTKAETEFKNIEQKFIKIDMFVDALKNDIQFIHESMNKSQSENENGFKKSTITYSDNQNGNSHSISDYSTLSKCDNGNSGNSFTRTFRKKMNIARKSIGRNGSSSGIRLLSPSSSSSSEAPGQDSNMPLFFEVTRKPNILVQIKPYTPHICNQNCAQNTFDAQSPIFRDEVPYAIPVILGWKREVATAHCRYDGNRSVAVKEVSYIAPCGRRLRNIEELDKYLAVTSCSLSIDYFTFEVYVELYYESGNSRIRCNWLNSDITVGRESKIISAINSCDDVKFPSDFNYISSRYEGRSVYIPRDPSFMIRCDCKDDCRNKSTCACQKLTIESTQSLPGRRKNPTAGYTYQRLKKFIVTGLYECNPYCSCSETCHNKVVQNGIKVRLQIFKTVRRGWGVRCLHDIPAGSFVCTYSGEIMTEHAANHYASVYGDEYLADLDFIDVCEAAKEGYESAPVEEISSDDDDADEPDDAKDEDYNEDQESDESFSSVKAKSNRRKAKSSVIKKVNDHSSLVKIQNVNNNIKKNVSHSGIRGGALSTYRSMNALKMSDGGMKFKSIRAMHDEDFSYTLDAKRFGNIGRFLNHSCSPNCFAQSVFVDTHDLRFPWVAFFANEFIPAFSELTWDYNYEIGSVQVMGKITKKVVDKTPRPYQLEALDKSLSSNTILCLPTGSGKTFIATIVLKNYSDELNRPYNQNGKRAFFLVPNQFLVLQQAKAIENDTTFTVGRFSGNCKDKDGIGIDDWTKPYWEEIFIRYQVLVLTRKIFFDILSSGHIQTSSIAVIVFDEAHHGAPNAKGKKTNHDYVRIMDLLKEKGLSDIRIIGLTASLINNRWVDENRLDSMIKEISNTFCADVFSPETSKISNANEIIWSFKVPEGWDAEFECSLLSDFNKIISVTQSIGGKKHNHSIDHADLTMIDEILGTEANPISLDIINSTFKDICHIYSSFGPWATHRAVSFVLGSYKRELELIDHLESSHNEIIRQVIVLLENLEKNLKLNLDLISKPMALLAGIPNKMLRLLQFLYEFNKRDKDPISAIIFVKRRLDAFVLATWLCNISKSFPEFDFIKSDFTVGFSSYNPFPFNSQFKKKQEGVITRFRDRTLNIVVSTSVLEEGLDITHCNCIIRYDRPDNYRAYVQSKGRARNDGAYFIFFCEENKIDEVEKDIEMFRKTERKLHFLSKPCQSNDCQIGSSFEMLKTSAEAILPSYEAKTRVIFYCDHLPSDGYTVKMPRTEISSLIDESTKLQLFRCKLTLPKISAYHKLQIYGRKCSTAAEAETSAYFEAIKYLWAYQELDDSFRPLDRKTLIARLMKRYNLEINRTELKEWEEQKAAIKRSITQERKKKNVKIEYPPKPGTKKKRRRYPIMFSEKLKGYQSMDSSCWMYKVSVKNENGMETSRLGLISFYPIPLEEINDKMFIYSSRNKLAVSLELIQNFVLKEPQLEKIRDFQEFLFTSCLKIAVHDDSKQSSIFFTSAVPAYHLLYIFLTDDEQIDYKLLEKTFKRRPIEPTDYPNLKDALISKRYGNHQKGLLVVEKVDYELSPKSPFVSDAYSSFEDYYRKRYDITSIKSDQPLLLCYAAPTKTFFPCQPDQKVMKRANTPKIVHLIPELCSYEYFSHECMDIIYTIPAISTIINQYLNASAIRKRLCSEIGYGISEIPVNEKYNWNYRYKFTNFPKMEVKTVEYSKPTRSVDLSCVIMEKISPSCNNNLKSKEMSHSEDELDECSDDNGDNSESDESDNDDYDDDDDDSSSETTEDDRSETPMDIPEDTYNTVYKTLPVIIKRPDESLFNDFAQPKIAKVSWNGNNVKFDSNLLQNYEKKLQKSRSLKSFPAQKVEAFNNNYGEDSDPTEEVNQYLPTTSIYTNDKSAFKYGLPIELIVEAFTTRKADPKTNLERLEIIGDSFLKYMVSTLLFLKLNDLNEARITWLKMNLVSNFYLLHLGRSKGLAQYMNDKNFLPRLNWLPPFYSSENRNFTEQEISDKSVADMMEALLGAHLICLGEKAAISFLSWLGMPLISSSNIDLSTKNDTYLPSYHDTVPMENPEEVRMAMGCGNLSKLEAKLGYTFKRKDLLIEALTHPSWSRSHFNSYQRLEFLGDAVLDYLITSYIFDNQNYQSLKPGEVTIIRQALVNNDYFATISLVNGFDKFIFHLSPTLHKEIITFKQQLINADLFGENKIKLGSFLLDNLEMESFTEAPKALGDIFESIAGAIYLDSGNSLSAVWHIYCKFLCNELEFFCANVPKSPILRLFEAFPFAKFVTEKLKNKEIKRKRLNLIVDDWIFKVDETKLIEEAMNKRTEKHYLVLCALNKFAQKINAKL